MIVKLLNNRIIRLINVTYVLTSSSNDVNGNYEDRKHLFHNIIRVFDNKQTDHKTILRPRTENELIGRDTKLELERGNFPSNYLIINH